MTFDQFLDKIDDTYHTNDEMRYGQSLMSVLWEVWPEKYKEITGSDFDCFYDDRTTRFTIEKLEKEWSNT